MNLKNYLYRFEFFSGFYESYFYRQERAESEKQAIIQIVGFFMNLDEAETTNYLNEELGKNWTIKKFWDKKDLRFFNGSEGYSLHWIKKVDFNLQDS